MAGVSVVWEMHIIIWSTPYMNYMSYAPCCRCKPSREFAPPPLMIRQLRRHPAAHSSPGAQAAVPYHLFHGNHPCGGDPRPELEREIFGIYTDRKTAPSVTAVETDDIDEFN